MLPILVRSARETPRDAVDIVPSLIAVVIVAIVFFIFYANIMLKHTKWREKSIFKNYTFNDDSLLEAHICLATQMIQTDRKDAKKKVIYVSNYFKIHFSNSEVDFAGVMNHAFDNPVDLNLLTTWLNKSLIHSRKLQVVYFIAGMSIVDGFMDQRELNLLQKISDLLELSPKDFDSIIASCKQKEERKESKSSKRPPSLSKKKRLLKLAFEVLGVSEHSDLDEIKKAYRTLVKRHHPDRFHSESEDQQEIAYERFLEIQKSYEIIEEHK